MYQIILVMYGFLAPDALNKLMVFVLFAQVVKIVAVDEKDLREKIKFVFFVGISFVVKLVVFTTI